MNKQTLSLLETIKLRTETKQKFTKFIKFLNSNKDAYISLDHIQKLHIKELIELWNIQNVEDDNIYFDMKNHHMYINGNLSHSELNTLWTDYIQTGQKFRVLLMSLHINNEMND
jgi:hypothetical protein